MLASEITAPMSVMKIKCEIAILTVEALHTEYKQSPIVALHTLQKTVAHCHTDIIGHPVEFTQV